jgi:hypothetical protein
LACRAKFYSEKMRQDMGRVYLYSDQKAIRAEQLP